MLMYRPSVVDSPSGRVPTKAPRWDLADTEGYVGGRPRVPRDRGARPIGGAPSYLVEASDAS